MLSFIMIPPPPPPTNKVPVPTYCIFYVITKQKIKEAVSGYEILCVFLDSHYFFFLSEDPDQI